MLEPLDPLCRADQTAGATDVNLAHFRHRFALALRAMVRENIAGALLLTSQILDHLRDHVAGALNAHTVAFAKPQPGDFVAVVQRHIGDDHPAHSDWSQSPDRRQLAGAPDLDLNPLQCCLGFFRREFMR
jgi:hypothetical protein